MPVYFTTVAPAHGLRALDSQCPPTRTASESDGRRRATRPSATGDYQVDERARKKRKESAAAGVAATSPAQVLLPVQKSMDTLAGAVQNSHSLMAETTQADDVQTRSPLFELPPRSQLGVAAPAESLQVAHGPADRSRREERAKTRKARRQKRWEELEIEEAYSDPELQDPDNVEELAAAEEAEAEA